MSTTSNKIEYCHLCGFPMLGDQCINSRCALFAVGKIARNYTFSKGGGSLPVNLMTSRGFDVNRLARGFRNVNRIKKKEEK